jgi:uncharacterized protein YkwD
MFFRNFVSFLVLSFLALACADEVLEFEYDSESGLSQSEFQLWSLINAAREQGGRCPSGRAQATKTLTIEEKLNQAAKVHAEDMATNNFYAHQSSNGSTLIDRLIQQDYQAVGTIGQNISIGFDNAQDVFDFWLNRDADCMNIFNPNFRDIGIRHHIDPKSLSAHTWVSVFGPGKLNASDI